MSIMPEGLLTEARALQPQLLADPGGSCTPTPRSAPICRKRASMSPAACAKWAMTRGRSRAA